MGVCVCELCSIVNVGSTLERQAAKLTINACACPELRCPPNLHFRGHLAVTGRPKVSFFLLSMAVINFCGGPWR